MGAATLPPDARRVTANVGMLLVLASWAMVFVTLLFAYGVIRTRAAVWPPLDAPQLPVGLAWLNTAVLLASSVTFHLGWQRLQRGGHTAFIQALAFTLGLGLLFLGLQAGLWSRIRADGLTVTGSLFGSWIYFMTIFHAVHILAGLGVLGVLLPAAAGHRLYPAGLTRVRLSGLFWHFLGVAWGAIFLALFIV